jgi:Zn-dependent protease
MFAMRWRLFRLLGIPVSVDISWLFILVLLTLSFAEGFPNILHDYFPGDTRQLPQADYWIMGLVTALAFFACIVLHEFGHALVARARGMPINGITLFLFGGVSELGEEPRSAGTEFLMAAAGPLVSAVLAAVFWVVAVVGYQGGWPHPVVVVLGYLATINALVLIFNLVPAFPLDGGRVLRSILWAATGNLRRATRWASYAGQTFAWVLITVGVLQFFAHDWVGGIWSVLIGMFLNSAARSGYQQVLLRQALQGEPVRRFMNANPIVVSPSLDLRHWVEDFVYRYHHRAFPVAANGRRGVGRAHRPRGDDARSPRREHRRGPGRHGGPRQDAANRRQSVARHRRRPAGRYRQPQGPARFPEPEARTGRPGRHAPARPRLRQRARAGRGDCASLTGSCFGVQPWFP